MTSNINKCHFGKNTLIIGGTSGIGAASAIKLAVCGANVAIVGRNEVSGKQLIKNIEKLDVDAIYIKADITNFAQVDSAFNKIINKFKSIDYAFNCAGVLGNDTILNGMMFHNSSEENWDLVMNTNVKAMWYCMKQELKHMYSNKKGVILNCSSVAGLKAANSKSAAYTASKHAVIGLTKATAFEYAETGIRINAICPGIIDTPLLQTIPKIKSTQNIGASFRRGKPEEVASVVSFLLSEEASYMHGSIIVIDAGGLCGVI